MANVKNLKPNILSTEEAKKLGSKGGKRSVEVRRERKAMKEQMEMLLSLPLKNDRAKAKFKELGVDTNDMNNQMALIVATYQKALKGDMQAMNVVRELVGERVQQVEINTNIDDKVKELHVILDNMKDEQSNN